MKLIPEATAALALNLGYGRATQPTILQSTNDFRAVRTDQQIRDRARRGHTAGDALAGPAVWSTQSKDAKARQTTNVLVEAGTSFRASLSTPTTARWRRDEEHAGY